MVICFMIVSLVVALDATILVPVLPVRRPESFEEFKLMLLFKRQSPSRFTGLRLKRFGRGLCFCS